MCPAHGSEEGVSAWVWPWWRLAIQSNLVAGHQTRLYHAIQVQCRSVLDGLSHRSAKCGHAACMRTFLSPSIDSVSCFGSTQASYKGRTRTRRCCERQAAVQGRSVFFMEDIDDELPWDYNSSTQMPWTQQVIAMR